MTIPLLWIHFKKQIIAHFNGPTNSLPKNTYLFNNLLKLYLLKSLKIAKNKEKQSPKKIFNLTVKENFLSN